jgi:hypothetical protein
MCSRRGSLVAPDADARRFAVLAGRGIAVGAGELRDDVVIEAVRVYVVAVTDHFLLLS